MFYLPLLARGRGTPTSIGVQVAMTSRVLKFPLFLASSALIAVYATAAIGLLQRL